MDQDDAAAADLADIPPPSVDDAGGDAELWDFAAAAALQGATGAAPAAGVGGPGPSPTRDCCDQ